MALTDNIISHYPLESNSNDSIGGFDGTDTSMSYVSGGKIGNCASFSGSGYILSNASLGLSAHTIMYGVKIATNPTAGNRYVLHFLRDNVTGGVGRNMSKFYYVNTAGTLSVKCSNSNDTSYTAENNYDLGDSTWHLITFVLDSVGGTQRIYVDGTQLSNTGTQGTGLSGVTTPSLFGLGAQPDFTNKYVGLADEVYLWNRALSAGEISQIYNGGNWLTYPFVTSTFIPRVTIF